jgi:uncharacterized membrane protein YbhN (UPF0104 family)
VKTQWWRLALRLVQIIVTISLVAVLLRTIDWLALAPVIAALSWPLIGVSIVCLLFAHLLNVIRWRFLVHTPGISYAHMLVYYGAGLFSNNFLPTGIGGDGVRALLLSRDIPIRRAIFSVGLDRMIGLVALSAFVAPGLWFGLPPGIWSGASSELLRTWGIARIIVFMSILGCGFGFIALRWSRKLRGLVWNCFERLTGITGMPHWNWRYWLKVVAGGYGLSVISNLGTVAAHWAVLQALGIFLSPGAAIWLVLLASLSMLLPIAVNGLGLQESVYIVILSYYDVPAISALGVALLIRLLMTFFSLLGGLISLAWKTPIPASRAQTWHSAVQKVDK